ncbi:MAG: TIGR03086 family metal-binding protein [Acidimicrobiia bacterium]
MPVDLEPAARRLADLVGRVPDELLDAPTPCPAYTLGDLVDHVSGAALAFTGAAVKDTGDVTSQAPSGDASRLGDDWQTRIPRDLVALAAAWRDPDAWTGMTKAGGVELPGEVAGLVALDEIVVHGWDVARATGQAYDCDAASLEAVQAFVSQFSEPGQEEMRAGLFGPVVEVPEDAPLLERVIGLTGRDPAWSPR